MSQTISNANGINRDFITQASALAATRCEGPVSCNKDEVFPFLGKVELVEGTLKCLPSNVMAKILGSPCRAEDSDEGRDNIGDEKEENVGFTLNGNYNSLNVTEDSEEREDVDSKKPNPGTVADEARRKEWWDGENEGWDWNKEEDHTGDCSVCADEACSNIDAEAVEAYIESIKDQRE